MAAPLPFAESEIRLLTALLCARVRFMVVGLSAATMQGAPVVTQDVDLWFGIETLLPFSFSQLRPFQMLVQEIERALAIDRVRSGEPFDLRAIPDAQLAIV